MNEDISPENIRIPMPRKENGEMFAVVDRMLGGSRMNVVCDDGNSRMARIPGSKRKRIKRLRTGDLLIIKPWDIQNEKADIVLQYRPYQAKLLSQRHLIPEKINVF